MKTIEEIKERLEYLRGELKEERISYDELHELQCLARHIDSGDVELLEAAGVPEFSCKILDWAGNEMYHGKTFDSGADAWDFLTEDQHRLHPDATDDEFDEIMGEFQTVACD